jgi:hypothetical protein
MNGYPIAVAGRVAMTIAPKDLADGTESGAWVNAALGEQLDIVIMLGATAGDPTLVTLQAATNAAGANPETIPFSLYRQETTGSDVQTARESIAAAGFDPVATDNIVYICSVDTAYLPPGKPYVRPQIACPAGANLGAALAIITGLRNQTEPPIPASALT